MTEKYELSRRKALAALGTIGVAGAGAGLGTSAYFSDQETFTNNQLTAGELDLKVAISQHYVDWLPDTPVEVDTEGNDSPQETDDASMADGDADLTLPASVPGDPDTDDDTKTDPIELDVSDAEGLAEGSLVNEINNGVPCGGRDTVLCDADGDFDDDDAERPIVQLDDVKPGDFGLIRLEFASCTNPAFVQLEGQITDRDERGYTEPEREDPDEDGPETENTVELIDEVRVALVQGDVAQQLKDGKSVNPIDESMSKFQSTLRALDGGAVDPLGADPPAEDSGAGGDEDDCFKGETNYQYTLIWWLPINHANEIQSDSVTFEIGLYTEQCRHNEGFGNDNTLR